MCARVRAPLCVCTTLIGARALVCARACARARAVKLCVFARVRVGWWGWCDVCVVTLWVCEHNGVGWVGDLAMSASFAAFFSLRYTLYLSSSVCVW